MCEKCGCSEPTMRPRDHASSPTHVSAHIAQVAPGAQVLETAPATGAGMEAWYAFLEAGLKQTQK